METMHARHDTTSVSDISEDGTQDRIEENDPFGQDTVEPSSSSADGHDSKRSEDKSADTDAATRHAANTDTSAKSQPSTASSNSSADRIVEKFHRIDQKVATMSQNRMQDPDTLGEKIFKFVFPTVLGGLAGKVFKTIWDSQVTSKRGPAGGDAAEDADQQGLIGSILFAAASAAFGSVISELGTRGSNALVNRHQSRRNK
jgi:hypothetical protein